MCVLPVQRGGQPLLAARPADEISGTKIDDMRATAEGVEAGSGAGQGILCRDLDYAAWPVPRLENVGLGHAAIRHIQSDSRKASS
jgi:hypothetical protein